MIERLAPFFAILRGPILGRAWPLTLIIWGLLALCWLLDITGHGLGLGLSQALALLAFALTGLTCAALLAWLLGPWNRPWGRMLVAVLAVAFTVGLMGLEFEVGDGYYTDEGHYLRHAQRVNSGQLFARTMVYPHLLYYSQGFALWVSELFPEARAWLAAATYGVETPRAVPWLVLRLVTATLGILTVVPVFLAAWRLAGGLAAVVASGAVMFAAHFHEGFHVNICDVPSGTFAAFCVAFVVALQEEESTELYLAAGLSAGLAAASKHPAGLVAVAIVAVWVGHRIRQRDLGLGLLWAGLAALGTYLTINPSFFVFPQETLFGQRGLFFGAQLYSEGGWIGVTPQSTVNYYLRQLLLDFRWPLVILATIGVWGLPAAVRRRWWGLWAFPVVFFWLITSVQIVVVRNLFPLIPALAILLGTAVAGVPRPLEKRLGLSGGRGVPVVVALVALIWPAVETSRQALALSRPGTRQLMVEWIRQHVPRGAGLLVESYTPRFSPVWYPVQEQRFALRLPEPIFDNPRFDYIVFSELAHGRFFRKEHQTEMQADWYRRFFEENELAHEVTPGPLRMGPRLKLYRLGQDLAYGAERVFEATEAFLPNPRMVDGAAIRFVRRGQFALFKAPLAAGSLHFRTEPPSNGEVRVLDGAKNELARFELVEGQAEMDLGEETKVFVYLYLEEGSRLERLHISRGAGLPEPSLPEPGLPEDGSPSKSPP